MGFENLDRLLGWCRVSPLAWYCFNHYISGGCWRWRSQNDDDGDDDNDDNDGDDDNDDGDDGDDGDNGDDDDGDADSDGGDYGNYMFIIGKGAKNVTFSSLLLEGLKKELGKAVRLTGRVFVEPLNRKRLFCSWW